MVGKNIETKPLSSSHHLNSFSKSKAQLYLTNLPCSAQAFIFYFSFRVRISHKISKFISQLFIPLSSHNKPASSIQIVRFSIKER